MPFQLPLGNADSLCNLGDAKGLADIAFNQVDRGAHARGQCFDATPKGRALRGVCEPHRMMLILGRFRKEVLDSLL